MKTNISHTYVKLLVACLLVCGSSVKAVACGCLGSVSFNLTPGSADDINLYANASFSISYLCQGEVTATITAPDSTYTEVDSGLVDYTPISVQDSYGTDQEGTYAGTGTFYYDGTDSGYGSGYTEPQTASGYVTKVRAYYYNSGTYAGLTKYSRCNTGSGVCPTLLSKQTDGYILITVWQFQIGFGLTCTADPDTKVVVSMCMSPDPIP